MMNAARKSFNVSPQTVYIFICPSVKFHLVLDTQDICVGGMKLRHRVATKEKCDGLETSEVSSEVDSDDSDNWVVSRNRKNRRKKRKKGNPALLNSSKKKRTSEEVENA
jgi:hypothetical protein